MDVDATVKPIHGHQAGDEIGDYPHKPGHPSHVDHSLFVRCAQPERPREAVTSCPLFLCAVGRLVKSSGQTTLRLTGTRPKRRRRDGGGRT